MKQGYNSRLDESMAAKNGKKTQSMKSRRNESKAMSKKDYGHSYGGDHSMSYEHQCIAKGKVGSHLSSVIKK